MHGTTFASGAKTYATILAALLVLTAITVAAAGIHFGSPAINVVVALVIASVKASLVALYFMHLRYDKPINAIIFTSSIFFLGLFLIFCMIDEGTRDQVHPIRDIFAAQPGAAQPGTAQPGAAQPGAAPAQPAAAQAPAAGAAKASAQH